MKVTITDIANDTGLALSTISKYLNHKKVQPENATLIEASIQKLGYTPNRIAQGLRSKNSRTVALLIPRYSNYLWGHSVSNITSALWKEGYTCILHTYRNDTKKQLQMIQSLISKKICGVIAVSGLLDEEVIRRLEKSRIPFVLMDQIIDSLSADYVTSDNYHGGYLAGSYLASKGHTRIGFIASTLDGYTIRERTRGFLDALRNYEIPLNTEYHSFQSSAAPTPDIQVRELLALKEPPTALFFCYYESCLAGITELTNLGISIPGDLSVIGFDDDILFSSLVPSITVIAQDFQEIGMKAADLLLERIADVNSEVSSGPRQKILVPVTLIERESVCNANE